MAIEVKREEQDEEYSSEYTDSESESGDENGGEDDDVCLGCVSRHIDLEIELLKLRLERLEKKIKDYEDSEAAELVSDLYNSVQQIQEFNSNLILI